jgi:hypothetical protein
MRVSSVAPLVVAMVAGCSSFARADQETRITGPHVHENLAVYFVHGSSAEGPVPLTLQEALAKDTVQVVETGQVNELQIENSGSEPVFIQSGDIVKGGKQDRVLTASLLLPPHSGRVGIASFCVEQGRWSARGAEDQAKFSSAREAMPSISALLAMAAPPPPAPTTEERAGPQPAQRIAREPDDVAGKQRKVWEEVADTQSKLEKRLNTPVASPLSGSSLQLALENSTLRQAREAYLTALQPAAGEASDIVGFVVAINGRMRAGSVYPSNALFRKMWDKQLAAVVTAAIGDKAAVASAPAAPAPPQAVEFLAQAEKGRAYERALPAGMRQETRDAEGTLYNEARAADGNWIHRSYLAK